MGNHPKGIRITALQHGLRVLGLGFALGWGVVTVAFAETGREELREALKKSPTGSVLLSRMDFLHQSDPKPWLEFAKESKTDAVLARSFDPNTGIEKRERQVSVRIKKDQSFEDQVLDLAHELTHATTPPTWDPYDPNLTAERYIVLGIEGAGGEVQAVANECKVGAELPQAQFGAVLEERCSTYLSRVGDENPKVDRDKIVDDFYRVGRGFGEFTALFPRWKTLFPALSSGAPRLYSSTGKTSYPLSLLSEYRLLNQIACENSRKRLRTAAAAPANRRPASIEGSGELLAPTSPIQILLKTRCKTDGSLR